MIHVFPIRNVPEIRKGDDLAEIFTQNFSFENGDVIAVCSTVVSKAEGRIVKVDEITPSNEAIRISRILQKDPRIIQAVLDESNEIILEKPFLLVRAKFGNICINAGIDTSNIEPGYILLPPENPDKSAEEIRKGVENITGKKVGVVITDTNGRCFRKGVVGFAIGVSGIQVMKDWRKMKDLYGKELEITVECIADEIAGFANLIMGEGDYGIPAVVFRGLEVGGEGSMNEIYRNESEDVIRGIIKEWKSGVS